MNTSVLDENGLPFLVSKYTRAPHDGREIVCPVCNDITRVYHFSWYAICCQGCGEPVKKPNWIVALTDKEKYTNSRKTQINTKMIHDTYCDINTKDYPEFCDSFFMEAHWVDGSGLTDRELEILTDDGDYLYGCIENQLY
tara:strand:- start:417 stop:836 length:420 start_codon:yes stop_codon:yes gene_type:complete